MTRDVLLGLMLMLMLVLVSAAFSIVDSVSGIRCSVFSVCPPSDHSLITYHNSRFP